jgi:hypothetical protein
MFTSLDFYQKKKYSEALDEAFKLMDEILLS